MTITTIGTTQVHVDAEGFLTDYDEWNEDLAKQLAAQIGIELTDAHFPVLSFLRADYAEQGETATLRRVSTRTMPSSNPPSSARLRLDSACTAPMSTSMSLAIVETRS